jgi:hypothetical protein
MLIHNHASHSILKILNQARYENCRQVVLTNHSLEGFLDNDSTEWKRQYFRNAVQLNFLKELAQDEENQLSFIVLKGMSLINYEVYSSLGDRLTGDIDLLVSDLNSFSEVLIKKGFSLVKNHQWKGNDFKRNFSQYLNGIEVVVELHTRLFYHSTFNEYRTFKTKEGFYVLAVEDLLVHLVGHLAFQHTFLKIHWLLDIYLLQETRQLEIDNKRVQFLLEKLKLKRSWYMTQRFVDVFFKERKFSNVFEIYFYDVNFLIFPEKNKFKYFVIKHLTKDSLLTSLNYTIHWFFQKGWLK